MPLWNGDWRIHQVVLEGNEHSLGSIPGFKFAEQAGDRMFNRVDGEMQLIGDFLIAKTPAQTT